MLGLPKNVMEHFKECVAAHLNIYDDPDADSDSGQSSFDEDYYNLKPPPISLDCLEKLTIRVLPKSAESAVPNLLGNSTGINSSVISRQLLTPAGYQENKINSVGRKSYSEVLKNSKPKTDKFSEQKVNTPRKKTQQCTSLKRNISHSNNFVGVNENSWSKSTKDPSVIKNKVLLQKEEKSTSTILYSVVLKTDRPKPVVKSEPPKITAVASKLKNSRKDLTGCKKHNDAISTENRMEGKKNTSFCANGKLPVQRKNKKKRKNNKQDKAILST